MREDEPETTATGEGMPEAPETPAEAPTEAPADPTPAEEAPEPAAASSEPPAGTVRVCLNEPRTTTAFRLPQADGSMLVVTHGGVDVPAAAVDDLIETARRHGVRLTRSTE